jgi:cytochrome c oxidase subunit 2
MTQTGTLPVGPLQIQDFFPGGSRVDVFGDIYWVFLVLGTLVGVVVIAYMLYNAYRYRDDGTRDAKEDENRPELGELPEGGGKGKKLFLSFALSAIIVISLIIWTYAMLLYVENGGGGAQAEVQGEEAMTVDVEGYQFGWTFIYPNGHESSTLRVPEDRRVRLNVTSRDVIHNFGIPSLRAKTDAIPGQTTETWFIADETGTYEAQCYELCGAGHSYMTSEVQVMTQSAYQEWYANTSGQSSGGNATSVEVNP